MTDPARATERRYRMGLIAEQAGLQTEQELMDIISIGMRVKYRLSLASDVLEKLRRDIESAKHMVDGITR